MSVTARKLLKTKTHLFWLSLLTEVILLAGFMPLSSQVNYTYGLNYNVPLAGKKQTQTSNITVRKTIGLTFGAQKKINSYWKLGTGLEINFLSILATINPVLHNNYGSVYDRTKTNSFTFPLSAERNLYAHKKAALSFYGQINLSFFVFKISTVDSYSVRDPVTAEIYRIYNYSQFKSGFFPGAKLGLKYTRKHFALSLLCTTFFIPVYTADFNYQAPALSERYNFKYYGSGLVLNIAYTFEKTRSKAGTAADP